jgi:guanine deaminase
MNVLGLPVGQFAVGMQFDAIVVETESASSGMRAWDGIDDDERVFEKIVRLARPADIQSVWVAGRRVTGASRSIDAA